jgi:hypothetical protein
MSDNLKFEEHQGLETEMTGMRCWLSPPREQSADVDYLYAIWEINIELEEAPFPTPYYRLNIAHEFNEHHQPLDWNFIGDYATFDGAEQAAQLIAVSLKDMGSLREFVKARKEYLGQ